MHAQAAGSVASGVRQVDKPVEDGVGDLVWGIKGGRGHPTAVGRTTTIADGGYPGTGLVMPHRRHKGEELPAWKQAHNKFHKQVRACVEHVFARMKTWKILRDCRLKGDGVHEAVLGIARPYNLVLAG